MLSTDVSSKAQAAVGHINYAAALLTEPAGRNPALYMISGPAARNQPMVFGSEPGKDDYSPLWQEITVAFRLPTTANIRRVTFTPNAGNAAESAEWDLP